MCDTLDRVLQRIQEIQQRARSTADVTLPRWPMIVLRTPKGWTGPKTVDGQAIEGTFRAHQVPLAEVRSNPAHLRQLEE
jgi:xylulose-5-phosphate/fructose-6-phosphate phosphoketolase